MVSHAAAASMQAAANRLQRVHMQDEEYRAVCNCRHIMLKPRQALYKLEKHLGRLQMRK